MSVTPYNVEITALFLWPLHYTKDPLKQTAAAVWGTTTWFNTPIPRWPRNKTQVKYASSSLTATEKNAEMQTRLRLVYKPAAAAAERMSSPVLLPARPPAPRSIWVWPVNDHCECLLQVGMPAAARLLGGIPQVGRSNSPHWLNSGIRCYR